MSQLPYIIYAAIKPLAHRGIMCCFAFTLAVQSACVTIPHVPNTVHQSALGRVAIITESRKPEIRVEGFAHGKGEGAIKGAAASFLTCVDALADLGCAGEFCGIVYTLWAGACGVTVAAGAGVGAARAPRAEAVQSYQEVLPTLVDAENIQQSLRRQTELFAHAKGVNLVTLSPEQAEPAQGRSNDYFVVGPGMDTLLEVTLTKVSISGKGINNPLLLRMEAQARLIRVKDSVQISSDNYVYLGAKRKLSEWFEHEGKPLLAGLNKGYEALGDHISDRIFMVYPFPDRKPRASGLLSVAFGLAPVYPTTRGQLSGDPILGSHFEWTTVDSLQPTLRWQEFPRAADLEAAPEDMGRVTDVRYELVIAREHYLAPDEIVYRRQGLPDARHTVETPLNQGTRYFWTVRAHFTLDGMQRVTEWGSTHFNARERETAPSQWSYRFKTG